MATTTVIYSTKTKGQVIFAGNTLGLAGTGANTEGFLNFPTADIPAPSGGTTNNWQQNSSSANLDLPLGATILHAELMWSTCLLLPNNQDLRQYKDTPISFTDPQGNTTQVTGRADTANDYLVNGTSFYAIRTATVTNSVSLGGTGFYTVGGVPSLLSNPAGTIVQEDVLSMWVLYVAYQLNSETFRNLNIYYFGGGNVPGRVTLNNISTPLTGPVDGHLLLSVGGGNSTRNGDQVWFGPTVDDLTQLSTPNNQPNNFFSSQINDRFGILDQTGTFGTKNIIPGQKPVVGDRQYCDLTGVNVSDLMFNGQTSAVLDIRSISSDGLAILGGALQVRENEYPTEPIKSVTPTQIDASVGGTLTYTVEYYISPEVAYAPTSTIIVQDQLPSPLTLVSSSLSLPTSPLYTIENISNGNIVAYRIITNVPFGSFLPPTFTMTIQANYPSNQNLNCISSITNRALMQVNQDTPLYSNTANIDIKCPNSPRKQSITDIIESVALEQTAISHILNAEGEKIQKIMELDLESEDIIKVNSSVKDMVNSISKLEMVLKGKLELFNDCICQNKD